MKTQTNKVKLNIVDCEVVITRTCIDNHLGTANLELTESLSEDRIVEIKININRYLTKLHGPQSTEAGGPRISELVNAAKAVSDILEYTCLWDQDRPL